MEPNDHSPEDGAPDAAPGDRGRIDPGDLFARAMNTVQPSPGANVWSPPPIDELNRLLPRYHVESLLGHGGMGAVYKGWQPTLDRAVAIKLLPAEIAGDEEFVARFEREARTLAKLQHPGIVSVYDFGRTAAGHLYFVMEYVDGTDLQKMLRGEPLQPAQALEAICQICEALHYAHRQGVIHRDIKPANILFTCEGRAKLADFGIARPSGDDAGTLTLSNMVMGTPAYMAPEQQRGHADLRADIYALGVMLYEMLTGQRPQGIFEMPSRKVAVDSRIDAVVIKALQQEPERRYQQVSEMQTDVDLIRTTPGQGIRKIVPKVVAKAAPARRRTLALVLAILLPLVALGGWFIWKMEHPRPTGAVSSAQGASLPVAPTPAPATPIPPSPPQPAPLPVVALTTTPQPPLATPPVTRLSPPPAPALEAMEPVLLANRWSYIDTAPESPGQRYSMEITFRPDGTVTSTASSGARLHWWITGPRTVHLQTEKPPIEFDARTGADITFDDALNKFDGRTSLNHTLTGARLGAALPEAPAVQSRIANFSEQGPNIAAWITAPLGVTVPDAIWENLNFLREALKDEAAQKPAASAAAYVLAVRHCNTLLAFLEERERASARAGGNAALHQKSNLTQAQRDHLTWPQYMLEKDERAERRENARTAPKFMNGNSLVEWNTRITVMRREMQALYAQLREAMRQPPAK